MGTLVDRPDSIGGIPIKHGSVNSGKLTFVKSDADQLFTYDDPTRHLAGGGGDHAELKVIFSNAIAHLFDKLQEEDGPHESTVYALNTLIEAGKSVLGDVHTMPQSPFVSSSDIEQPEGADFVRVPVYELGTQASRFYGEGLDMVMDIKGWTSSEEQACRVRATRAENERMEREGRLDRMRQAANVAVTNAKISQAVLQASGIGSSNPYYFGGAVNSGTIKGINQSGQTLKAGQLVTCPPSGTGVKLHDMGSQVALTSID